MTFSIRFRNYQWWIFRLSALTLVPGFMVDPEILLLIQIYLFLHLYTGLKTIIDDYIHSRKSKLLSLALTRVLVIELSRYTLEFFL